MKKYGIETTCFENKMELYNYFCRSRHLHYYLLQVRGRVVYVLYIIWNNYYKFIWVARYKLYFITSSKQLMPFCFDSSLIILPLHSIQSQCYLVYISSRLTYININELNSIWFNPQYNKYSTEEEKNDCKFKLICGSTVAGCQSFRYICMLP